MTKIAKVSLAVVMGSSILAAGANQMKLYEVESGKITYEIKGSGSIMGSKMESIGKKRVIFDENGAKNLTEENKIEKQTIMGQKQTTKSHTMTYMKNGMTYHVNFDNKRIMRMGNMGLGMAMLMGGEQNMKQAGEDMMKQMGGKKTGTDKVLGYTCDVWNIMGSVNQCMYKGVPLKVETNVMGLKTTEVATQAEFDISLSNDDFKLPDFPIYDMEGNKLDKSRLDAMDEKQSEASSKDTTDARNAMAAAMGALAGSGFDMNNPNAEMTKEQEEVMKNAMMNAMGGEQSILAQTKQEILEDAKILPQTKACFTKANSAKEANACERLVDSEDPEYHSQWNESIKSEMLKDMKVFEDAIPCIKNAETMKALQMCMPQ